MRTGRNTHADNSGVGTFDRRAMRGAVASLLTVALIANAAHAQIRSLMSNTWNGTQPSGHSDIMSGAAASNGGRYVAFASDASNLESTIYLWSRGPRLSESATRCW